MLLCNTKAVQQRWRTLHYTTKYEHVLTTNMTIFCMVKHFHFHFSSPSLSDCASELCQFTLTEKKNKGEGQAMCETCRCCRQLGRLIKSFICSYRASRQCAPPSVFWWHRTLCFFLFFFRNYRVRFSLSHQCHLSPFPSKSQITPSLRHTHIGI